MSSAIKCLVLLPQSDKIEEDLQSKIRFVQPYVMFCHYLVGVGCSVMILTDYESVLSQTTLVQCETFTEGLKYKFDVTVYQ